MPYFVYILYSQKVDRYYIGESEEVANRLKSHLSGISRYTAIADDWKLMYTETFDLRGDALRREKEIKKKKSRNYIEWLIASKK